MQSVKRVGNNNKLPLWARELSRLLYSQPTVTDIKYDGKYYGTKDLCVTHADGSKAKYDKTHAVLMVPDVTSEAAIVIDLVAKILSTPAWATYSAMLHDKTYTYINQHPVLREGY